MLLEQCFQVSRLLYIMKPIQLIEAYYQITKIIALLEQRFRGYQLTIFHLGFMSQNSQLQILTYFISYP